MFPSGIDLCHYDSDKSYEGRLRAYSLLWAGLKLGGLLISDDIQDNLAFAHFSRMTAGKPVVTTDQTGSEKFIGILAKNHSRGLRPFQF